MARHLRTELVLNALDMALERRNLDAVVHHSDQGCQYTSVAFSSRCRQRGVRLSMGSVGDCYDNALEESFFATLECELLHGVVFRASHKLSGHCSSISKAGITRIGAIPGWGRSLRWSSRNIIHTPHEFPSDILSTKPDQLHSSTSSTPA